MEKIDNIQQFTIYTDAYLIAPGCWEFVHKDKTAHRFPEFDFFLPIFLTRTNEIFEFVQINKDDTIQVIERQEVNPFFIELSFFDSIEQHKVLRGSDLTIPMIQYIQSVRPDLTGFSNQQVVEWFDQIGINELPWFKGTNNEVTADDIDKISLLPNHTISKADYFNIDINK